MLGSVGEEGRPLCPGVWRAGLGELPRSESRRHNDKSDQPLQRGFHAMPLLLHHSGKEQLVQYLLLSLSPLMVDVNYVLGLCVSHHHSLSNTRVRNTQTEYFIQTITAVDTWNKSALFSMRAEESVSTFHVRPTRSCRYTLQL